MTSGNGSGSARPAPPLSAVRRATLVGEHRTCTAQSMQYSYESGDVIGTGSFGIIRKVKRKQDGMILARKELNYGRMDERDLRQLTEEVNILEQLGSNDNIVRYHERFVDKPNNMLYILMEYCEGGDLSGVMQRCRKTGTFLSEDVVWAYLAQITLALYDCHTEVDSNGARKPVILHRDIKPENVFLDKENNLKLGDFGLSKAMQQASMTNTYVGTPYYMSPELINGQPYDVKSDVWALGCLIYELCAGHPPFHEARTQPELAVLIREGKIPDLPKPYTPHLGQVVKAMLKQNPKHRPNTSQIKALDSVKLQIRAIELRKATKELRLRDQQINLRENDLLAREASVLSRERAVLMRENSIRAGADKLRDDKLVFARERESREKERECETERERDGVERRDDRENERPMQEEDHVLARVASRPSLVPRRPLEERRASRIILSTHPSNLSLMSLDDTPTKPPPSPSNYNLTAALIAAPASLRKRLASKSMFDMKATAVQTASRTHGLTRMESMSNLLSRASIQDSPPGSIRRDGSPTPSGPATLLVPQFGRRSESVASLRRSGLGNTYENGSNVVTRAVPPSPSSSLFRPLAPSRTATAPAALDHHHRASPIYDDDNLPSPFLKKLDSSRFPTASNTASPTILSSATSSAHTSPTLLSRPSLPTSASTTSLRQAGRAAPAIPSRAPPSASANRPSMATRLLNSRAQASVVTVNGGAGGDEVIGRARRASNVGTGMGGLRSGRASLSSVVV